MIRSCEFDEINKNCKCFNNQNKNKINDIDNKINNKTIQNENEFDGDFNKIIKNKKIKSSK